MRWRQLRRLVSAAGLVILVALTLASGWPFSIRPARADAALTVTPTDGPPGTTVTVGPSAGTSTYSQGTTVTLYWVDCGGNLQTVTGQVGADGQVPTMTFTVPTSSPQSCAIEIEVLVGQSGTYGPYTFNVTGGTSVGSATPTIVNGWTPTATVTGGAAQISVPTGTVPPGGSFTISGSNFPANSSVTLLVTGNGLTQALTPSPTTDQSGAFSSTFIAPSTAGTYTLIATAGSVVAQTSLVVGQGTATPQTGSRLTVTPALVVAGQNVTVSGSGFALNSQVTITSSLGTTTASTDPSGAFSTSINVPSGTSGSVIAVTASDSSGHTATGYISLNNGQPATLSASPSTASPGQSVAVTGSNFAAGEQVTLGLALPSAPTTLVNGTSQTTTVDANRNLSASYVVPTVTGGPYLLVATGQSSNLTASAPLTVQGLATATPTTGVVPFPTETPAPYSSPTPTVTGTATAIRPTATATAAPVATETTYFAEGYTGQVAANGRASFDERLYLFNTANAPANVTVSYYIVTGSDGSTRLILRSIHLPARGASTLSVNADAGQNHLVSIAVGHTPGVVARIIVQRTDAKGTALDAASSNGSTQTATAWSFAEGYTGVTFQEYLSIFNPGSTAAHVQIHFLPTSGTPPAPLNVTVPPNGRLSPNVGGLYLLRANPHAPKSIALKLTSDQPIVADRTLYWGVGAGSGKYGYDITPGTPGGATNLVFAALVNEGANEPYLTVLNPNSAPVSMQVVFRDASGRVLVSYTGSVASLARLTVPVHGVVSKYSGVVSATLNATAPVVAEAPLYFRGSPNVGAHPGVDLLGIAPSTTAALAGIEATNATLYIYNPTNSTLRVIGLVGTASGSEGQGTLTVAPLHVLSASLPPGTGPRGLLLTGTGPFVAELINGADTSAAWGSTLSPPQ